MLSHYFLSLLLKEFSLTNISLHFLSPISLDFYNILPDILLPNNALVPPTFACQYTGVVVLQSVAYGQHLA